MEFARILSKSCALYQDRIAVSHEGRHLRYGELWQRACRLANGLLALGLERGDRVATLSDNGIESLEEICAFALAGLVRCPMYAQNTVDVHLYMLNLVEARVFIVEESYYREIAPRLNEVPSLVRVVVRGGSDPALEYEAVLAAASPVDPGVTVHEDDNHIIRFSAGTTGRPKGIVHSQRGWLQMGNEFALVLPRLTSQDAYLVAGAMSHASGLLVWPLLAHGARVVVLGAFDAGKFLETVEREKCTQTLLVPTMIQAVVNHPEARRRDLSSLRAVLYGAAPITERTLTDALSVWGNIMYQLYGQSESMPASVLTPEFHVVDGPEHEKRRLRSAGRPTPNSVVRILDDEGREVAQGEVGEICTMTPGNMKEIWRNPQATAERMVDGFVRTRDIGYIGDDGFLYLADRKEDMIISGGFNIWPAEVENALASHPAVLETVVVGVPHEKWGETVMAVVRLRPEQQASEQELIDWCRERIGSVKKPTRVEFSREPLPKSAVGKLLRRAVRQKYWGDGERQVSGA